MKKVIVIGAGVGGLSTAIRLLNKGYEVTIFEKESRVGGKVNSKDVNGFKFDLTASILMTPNIYTEIFQDSGRNYEDYFQLIKLEPIYNVNYRDGSNYRFYSDLSKMSKELEVIKEGLSSEYVNFIYTSLNKYLISNDYLLNEPMVTRRELLNFKTMYNIAKINPFTTVDNYISQLISNSKLKEYLIFQSMYIGVNPYISSNLYAMIPTISHAYGLYYVKGGFYNYIKALEKLVYELGGIIHKESEVQKILVENKKVIGVLVNETEQRADIVLCNADFPYAISNLFSNKVDEGIFKSSNIDKKEYSYSVFIIYLGLSQKYNELEVHNIYINEKLRESIEEAYEGIIPEKPSIYIYYPSKIDDTLAAKGKSTMNIMVRVPNLKVNNIKWNDKIIKIVRDRIIGIIKGIKGLEDIEESIEVEEYLTPNKLEEMFNAYYGNAFGISHKISQCVYFRPHIKSKKIKGLYYIGSSTHPGNGVSIILDGSKLVANLIDRDY